MTNRFYIPDLNASSQLIKLTDKKIIHQVTKVLRLQKGDMINIFSQSDDINMKIINIQPNYIQTELIKKNIKSSEASIDITLYQAMLKKDNFEWVVQKATELGAKKIVPIITDYTIIREISKNKMARYEKIAIEATEQCGGVQPPIIAKILKFDQAVQEIKNKKGTKIISWEGEKSIKISAIIKKNEKEYHILIGPEGGFTPNEVKLAINNNIYSVSLGPRIFRAETAAIATLSLILLNN